MHPDSTAQTDPSDVPDMLLARDMSSAEYDLPSAPSAPAPSRPEVIRMDPEAERETDAQGVGTYNDVRTYDAQVDDDVQVTRACEIPEIKLGRYRMVPELTGEQYESLMESIRVHGVQVPVETDPDGWVIDGEARVRACVELGLTDYPVIVRFGMDDEEKREQSLRLNCQRRSTTPKERGELVDSELQRNSARSDHLIAELCGSSHTTVGRHRRALEQAELIDAGDRRTARNGESHPARKTPRPCAIVPQAESVSEFLDAVSDVEPCDLSGRMYTSAELSRLAADERRRREQRESQVASESDDAAAEADDDDQDDPGRVDMVVAEIADAAGLAELAVVAARTLKWGASLTVRVPTDLVAECIGELHGPLHYTYTFVDVAAEPTLVALPIPLERRASHTLLFRQPCPKGREAHKQALIGDVVIHDGAVDPLVLLGRLVGAYTHPGDLVLIPSGDGALVKLCHDLERRSTCDPNAGPDGTPESGPSGDGPKRPQPPIDRDSLWRSAHCDDAAPQLTAEWEPSGDVVSVLSGGHRIALLPVERVARGKFLKRDGNDKVDHAGVINGLAHACFRGALPHPGCDLPCYAEPGRCHGCFANLDRWAMRKQNVAVGYNVIHNSLVNDRGWLRIPRDGDWCLSSTPPTADPALWRVDSESGDGSMSIALGLIQRYAEATPEQWFFTFASHAFAPTDEALDWMASLGNAWVLHTLSGCFSEQELDVRFRSFERYLDAGVPSVAYVVTSGSWDDGPVLARTLDLLGSPEFLIEEPRRVHNNLQEKPSLGVNPLGHCSQTHCSECSLKCGFIPLVRARLLDPPYGDPAVDPAFPPAIEWADDHTSEVFANVG